MNNDKEAIALALRTCDRVTPKTARVVRIKNSMQLSRILISEACLAEAQQNESVSIVGSLYPMEFDEKGCLLAEQTY